MRAKTKRPQWCTQKETANFKTLQQTQKHDRKTKKHNNICDIKRTDNPETKSTICDINTLTIRIHNS